MEDLWFELRLRHLT